MKKQDEKEISFEDAFKRLEEILEQMNSSSINLEKSIALFEEADKLIVRCGKQLSDAERKIETLIKNRTGDVSLDAEGKPLTEDFSLSSKS